MVKFFYTRYVIIISPWEGRKIYPKALKILKIDEHFTYVIKIQYWQLLIQA